MSLEFFKPRGRFDISKSTLDIGNPFFWDRKHILKHFFLRVFVIPTNKWDVFYNNHLTYYLKKYPEAKEETFFNFLWSLVATRLKTLGDKDIYESKTHVRDQKEIAQLKSFTAFLISIDKWNFHETDKEIILRQQAQLNTQQNKITKLSEELRAFKLLEPTDQINIHKGNLLTLVDLFLQLKELKLDDKKELVFSITQAVWMKMICKYFTENNEPIKFERLKRYFSPDPENPLNVKHADVPSEKRLFKIIPAKKIS